MEDTIAYWRRPRRDDELSMMRVQIDDRGPVIYDGDISGSSSEMAL